MRVFDIFNAEGQLHAFEVSNTLLSRRGVARIVSSVPGAEITRRPLLFSSFREDEFCEFNIKEKAFVAWEPFGDSSRYHIGQKPSGPCQELSEVRQAFIRARPFGF